MTNQEIQEKQQFWREKYDQFKKTNLSQNKFCQRHGLIPHKCSYYFLKFKKEDQLANAQGFSELIVKNDGQSKTIDPTWLAKLIKELHEVS